MAMNQQCLLLLINNNKNNNNPNLDLTQGTFLVFIILLVSNTFIILEQNDAQTNLFLASCYFVFGFFFSFWCYFIFFHKYDFSLFIFCSFSSLAFLFFVFFLLLQEEEKRASLLMILTQVIKTRMIIYQNKNYFK